MSMKFFACAAILALLSACAHPNPYAGGQDAAIKALSAVQVEQYLSGAGAGYAKAAELNHHPGPLHLLELADQIGLADAQRAEARRLLDSHKAEARAIGARVVQSERDLDALFRRGGVGSGELAHAVQAAAALEGEYRLAHLETHRRLRALLTAQQVARYDELRGYAGGGGHSH
jgi:hypothetical protein